MRRNLQFLLTLILFINLSGQVSAAPGSTSRTIRVDCDKGQTLTAALADRNPILLIELTGACTEDVLIERDSVTIRGLDSSASVTGSITILHRRDIALEDFIVLDGLSDGITAMDGTLVRLSGMTVRGHTGVGLWLARGSIGIVANSVFEQNRRGIAVTDSHIQMDGTVTSNGNNTNGILLSAGTAFSAPGSTITTDGNDHVGLWLQNNSSAAFWGTTRANGNTVAGFVALGGVLFLKQVEATFNVYGADVEFGGVLEISAGNLSDNEVGVNATEGSVLRLWTPAVTNNGEAGVYIDGSTALLDGPTISGNPVDAALSFGANVTFRSGASVATPLVCDETVLTRGVIACPPSPTFSSSATERTTSDHKAQRRPLPSALTCVEP